MTTDIVLWLSTMLRLLAYGSIDSSLVFHLLAKVSGIRQEPTHTCKHTLAYGESSSSLGSMYKLRTVVQ
jgi:hypothetical protein